MPRIRSSTLTLRPEKMATRHSSVHSLPVKAVPTGFERVEMDGHFRANRLVCLINNCYVPDSPRLKNWEVVFATSFGADNGITVPVILADQPHSN
jgi:hypothetical protein